MIRPMFSSHWKVNTHTQIAANAENWRSWCHLEFTKLYEEIHPNFHGIDTMPSQWLLQYTTRIDHSEAMRIYIFIIKKAFDANL